MHLLTATIAQSSIVQCKSMRWPKSLCTVYIKQADKQKITPVVNSDTTKRLVEM